MRNLKNRYIYFHVLIKILLLLVSCLAALAFNSNLVGAQIETAGQLDKHIYLPFITNNYYHGFSTENKFIGISMQQYWTDGDKGTVAIYMTQADTLAGGKKHSVSGWFIDIQDLHFTKPPALLEDNNLYGQLEALWQKGYVSFVNINSTATASAIASGQLDNYLRNMAGFYADWVGLGGGRKAFLAPLPEMNGVYSDGRPWASYGGDPVNFKLAFQRIQNIFSQQGVSADQVWWVFAPNGWSKTGHEFEKYYPGSSSIDIVAFSSYNYGFCQVAFPYQRWENYDTIFSPYLTRIQSMAQNKPVIIAQTGSTAQYQSASDFNAAAKNNWLRTNYEFLSNQTQVLGILYYDFDQSSWECNWKITGGTTFKSGYQDATAFPVFRYLSAQDLQTIIP